MSELVPYFSVVVPAYNRAHVVLRAVHSVLGQTFGDFELIVVDDGGSDDTEQVLATVGDPRLHYVRRERNGGMSAARNTGVEHARGLFLTFLDSDDEAMPTWLETFAAVLDPVDRPVARCGMLRLGPDGFVRRIIWPAPPEEFERWMNTFLAGTYALRRDVLDEAGGYCREISFGANSELSLRIAELVERYGWEVPVVRAPRVRYFHNSRVIPREARVQMTAYVLERHDRLLHRHRSTRATYLGFLGASQAVLGDTEQARRTLLRAWLASPLRPRSAVRLAAVWVPPLGRLVWRTPAAGSCATAASGRTPGPGADPPGVAARALEAGGVTPRAEDGQVPREAPKIWSGPLGGHNAGAPTPEASPPFTFRRPFGRPRSVSVVVLASGDPGRTDAVERQLKELAGPASDGMGIEPGGARIPWEVVVAAPAGLELAQPPGGWGPSLPYVWLVAGSGDGTHLRNRAAAVSTGDFLVFCRSTDRLPAGWLRAMVDAAPSADLLTGLVGVEGEPWVHGESDRELSGQPWGDGLLPFDLGANCGIWRDAWHWTGGWNAGLPDPVDDIELFWRARLCGFHLGIAPGARVRRPAADRHGARGSRGHDGSGGHDGRDSSYDGHGHLYDRHAGIVDHRRNMHVRAKSHHVAAGHNGPDDPLYGQDGLELTRALWEAAHGHPNLYRQMRLGGAPRPSAGALLRLGMHRAIRALAQPAPRHSGAAAGRPPTTAGPRAAADRADARREPRAGERS